MISYAMLLEYARTKCINIIIDSNHSDAFLERFNSSLSQKLDRGVREDDN